MIRIYYFWSPTCPWCSKFEKFIDVLEVNGFEVIRHNIETTSSILDINKYISDITKSKGNVIAPLVVIELKRKKVKEYKFVVMHSSGKKDYWLDVANMVLYTLRALRMVGINVDPLLEDKVVAQLLSPLYSND